MQAMEKTRLDKLVTQGKITSDQETPAFLYKFNIPRFINF